MDTYTFSLKTEDYEVKNMEIIYIEHGNLELLQREVNHYLSKDTWKPLGPADHKAGRWVQCLVKE